MCPMKERILQTQIIYGPVNSRRLGRSLGVNILPTERKVCSFDCIYCQYGFADQQYTSSGLEGLKLPGAEQVAEALKDALPTVGDLEAITLAGNGEPTLHPSFRQIAEAVSQVSKKNKPGVPVCILSNSSTVSQDSVQAGLSFIDRKIMKLDAGRENTFQKINMPRAGITLKKIVDGLARLEKVEIQSLFFSGPVTNASPEEVTAWLEQLALIKPVALQVYTMDRVPADRRVEPVDTEELERIAAQARARLPEADVIVY
jgi:wyosine [tRNA(Phe)-imidazoG37] synthetase (radical SAM superfamily)